MAAVWAHLEKEGKAQRVLQDSQERPPPVLSRAAIISPEELVLTRKIRDIIREGRVTKIQAGIEGTTLVFGNKAVRKFERGTVFVGWGWDYMGDNEFQYFSEDALPPSNLWGHCGTPHPLCDV